MLDIDNYYMYSLDEINSEENEDIKQIYYNLEIAN